MSADTFANLRLAAWRDALRVLIAQFAALAILWLAAALGWGVKAGLGALIGAGIGLLANAYLAFALVGRSVLTGKPGNVILSWLIKVALTLSLLWIAMRVKIVPPLSLIAGLFGSMVAHWCAVTFWLSGRR